MSGLLPVSSVAVAWPNIATRRSAISPRTASARAASSLRTAERRSERISSVVRTPRSAPMSAISRSSSSSASSSTGPERIPSSCSESVSRVLVTAFRNRPNSPGFLGGAPKSDCMAGMRVARPRPDHINRRTIPALLKRSETTGRKPGPSTPSGQQLADQLATVDRRALGAAVVKVGQIEVVQAQQVQDRRVDVVDVARPL